MKDKKIINNMLIEAQNYFDEDEKIYVFQCKKYKKYDPVPGFIVSEQIGFLKFSKQKAHDLIIVSLVNYLLIISFFLILIR